MNVYDTVAVRTAVEALPKRERHIAELLMAGHSQAKAQKLVRCGLVPFQRSIAIIRAVLTAAGLAPAEAAKADRGHRRLHAWVNAGLRRVAEMEKTPA